MGGGRDGHADGPPGLSPRPLHSASPTRSGAGLFRPVLAKEWRLLARDPGLETARGQALRVLQELFDWRPGGKDAG